MTGGMQFHFTFGKPQQRVRESADDGKSFRVLVLGDFSGRGESGDHDSSDIWQRTRHVVDIDNFDEVMVRICPRIALAPAPPGAPSTCIEFHNLDDFAPDRWCHDVPALVALQETRRELENPATFASAAEKLRLESSATGRAAPLSMTGSGASEADASTLERLLGTKAAKPASTTPKSTVEQWLQQVVAPHVVPDAPPFQGQYIDAIDDAIDQQLRGLLHDPAFQALESAWRGLHRLTARFGADERLQICIMDVSRQELVDDLRVRSDDKASSGLHKTLVQAPRDEIEGARWSVLVGLYSFSLSEDDVATLTALADVAADAGVPFIGAADSTVFGCPSLPDAADPAQWTAVGDGSQAGWGQLRTSPQAAWIGLAAPRFMLRLPYGEKTEPTGRPQFEEFTAASVHSDYLWGNPALLVAELLMKSLLERERGMEPRNALEIGDLPAHVVERDGEKRLHACAEAFLGERAGERMLGCGVMPVISFRNRNAIRVLRMQSIASPARPLAGAWVPS